MDDNLQLPPLARAKRYRSLAGDARRAAESIEGEVRSSYLMLAVQWDRLAVEAEKRAADPPADGCVGIRSQKP